MNYGNPDDTELPIHEHVRQSRAALCGMAPSVEPGSWTDMSLTPLLSDKSTARWNADAISEFVRQCGAGAYHALSVVLKERDDLARRNADLENMVATYEGRGVGVRLPAAGVPQSDYDRLLESYHVANRLARELRTALEGARAEIESLKAQEVRHPVAPAVPPHGNPAALGDYANEVLTDFSLPEPARLNESIPGSAALHDARPVSAKPAPGPMPVRALRHSR